MYVTLWPALIALLPHLGTTAVKTRSFIYGGTETNITQVPYVVSVHQDGSFVCGGSILSKYHVLTAAYCVSPEGNYTVRSGSSYSGKNGTIHRVRRIAIHSQFDDISPDYDVSVLLLQDPIEFSEFAKPIGLPESEPAPGAIVRVHGWGLIMLKSDSPLLSIELELVRRDECGDIYPLDITQRMICAARQGKYSYCGDTGAGLDYQNSVVGIVSFGLGCSIPGIPGIHTNVYNPEILDFINEQLKQEN